MQGNQTGLVLGTRVVFICGFLLSAILLKASTTGELLNVANSEE